MGLCRGAPDNETADTLVGFFDRAFGSVNSKASDEVAVDEVITCPLGGRAQIFQCPTEVSADVSVLGCDGTPSDHIFCRSRTVPQTIYGKAERFNRDPRRRIPLLIQASDQNPTADADSKPGSTTTISTATTPSNRRHTLRRVQLKSYYAGSLQLSERASVKPQGLWL